jgi:hypothetical protein
MVTPRGGEEYYLSGIGVKYGCDYRYIWEVASIGCEIINGKVGLERLTSRRRVENLS